MSNNIPATIVATATAAGKSAIGYRHGADVWPQISADKIAIIN